MISSLNKHETYFAASSAGDPQGRLFNVTLNNTLDIYASEKLIKNANKIGEMI